MVSCDKGYDIRCTNYYLEPLDSVVVGDNMIVFKNVGLESSTEFSHAKRGQYAIKIITKSKKKFNSSIWIPGKGSGKRTIQIDAIEQINILEE
ncbi:hypothetical protein CNR22_05365 [Sphingobacteriaceae bacterium]|nr:hypothetical protein CNR22_05365 [Sphingobacteriaceae bacterium]